MSHFWNCINGPIEEYSNNIFEKVATHIYNRPLIFIMIGFILSSLMGLGLINATFSNDIIELYTPQETTSEYPDDIYNEYMTSKNLFGSSLGSTLILILSSKDSTTKTILTPNGLDEAYNIYNTIHSINIPTNYTYTDLCEKQYSYSSSCINSNNFFAIAFTNTSTNQIDSNMWQNTDDIDQAMDNAPDKLRLFIGGNDRSLLLSYSLSTSDDNGIAKEQFINNWILYWNQHKTDYSEFHIHYITPISFTIETEKMLHNNVKLLIVSIFLLLIYMMIMYGKLSMVYSRFWLAFGGIISISLSIIAGFGLASAANYPFTVYIFLLPFIVFGVGIDIMIYTIDIFNNIPLGDDDKQRFNKLVSNIGYLITISTLITILAFSFGCVVEMSGVKIFCVFALSCFIFNYINFWLIILPIMIYDNKRIANNKNAMICCIESHTSSKEEKRLPYISQLLNITIIKIINNRIGRYCIILLFIILFILSAVSIKNTNTTSDPTNFISSDSYLTDFYNIYNRDFNSITITELDIIIENVDFSQAEIRDNFNDLFIDIDNTTYIISNMNEWLSDFELFVINDLSIINGLDGLTDSQTFYLTLQQWINSTITNGNNNWGKDIIFDNPYHPTMIRATRFFLLIFESNDNKQLEIRDEYMNILDMYDYGNNGNVFIFTDYWALIYFNFVVLSYTEAIMIFSGIGMFFILWIFIDWRIIFIMIINVIMIYINLFGWINMCNIILDSMTFIQCLMSIGFTIDYILYITYIINKNNWQIIDNNNNYLLIIITSLCRSAFTTWIALLPLAFADNYGFIQFYIMFTGIIFIALFQSILFTVCICIEINLFFKYISNKTSKNDIKNLTAQVEMDTTNGNNNTKHQQTKTPSIELGENIIDIDNGQTIPKTRRKASSIDIMSCAPIVMEQKQQEPMTPDEQLGVNSKNNTDIVKSVQYKIKIEQVS